MTDTENSGSGAMALPPDAKEIFEKKAFAFLGTNGADGFPQVTPVWVELEDGRLTINTAEGRAKHRNIQRDPRVSLSAIDPQDPYRSVTVKGRATMTTEGADEQIDRLAKKYVGMEKYEWRQPGEVRVKVHIDPTASTGG